MPDYIYLLENRLSADQRHALLELREAARKGETILFLTGDAVRDLTGGHAVRELEVAVHGNALKLRKSLEESGAKVWGEDEASRTLYLCFPGTVRVDLVSTHRVEFVKPPGKPVFHPASIQEDLRRRDFTVNAMAISLNEGSFGLLMDPLNGAADIEARSLRLVSNYGFLEDPALLIRATRYRARLGWELEERTQTRYENAKNELAAESVSSHARSRELEQIGHEEDGLKVLKALEAEGWMQVLYPPWTAAKADEEKLKALHDLAVELLMQGVHADVSAAQMQLLTLKLAPKDLAALKKLMLRPGFVGEWDSLDAIAAQFSKVLLSKPYTEPSEGYKLFTGYDPEAVLWLGFTAKSQAVLDRYNQFLKVWPEFRQKIPYALMQEMRITPELAGYNELVQAIFLELIDGKLTTTEELRAYLEPHSPPAPPPQVSIKRPRAKRNAEAKMKEESFDEDEEAEESLEDEDLDEIGGDEDEVDLGLNIPKSDLDGDAIEDDSAEEDEGDDEESEPEPATPKSAVKKPGAEKKGHAGSAAATEAPVARAEAAPARPAAKTKSDAAVKSNHKKPAAKAEPVKPAAKPQAPAKSASKPAAKQTGKVVPKPHPKTVPKPAPIKAKAHPVKPHKPAPKKPIGKSAKKH